MTAKTNPMTTGDDVMRERNARVQARYDALMLEGKHGHYETMFRVVREEVERASKVTVDEPAVERALDEYEEGLISYWRNNPTDEPTADLVANFKTRMRAALEAAFPASASEWNAAIKAAAKVADEREVKWGNEWRAGLKSDSHLEGMADGASDISSAIRALSKKD